METGTIEASVETQEQNQATENKIDFSKHESEFTNYLTEKGFVVKTKIEIEDEIGSGVRNAHEAWEKKLEQITGQTKPKGTKGLVWAEEVYKPMETTTQTEITQQNQEQPKPSTVAEDVEKKKVSDLEKQLSEMQAQLKESEQKQQEKTIKIGIRSNIRSLKLIGETPEDTNQRQKDVEDLLLKQFEFKTDEDNELVAYENGSPVLDNETNTPIKVDKLIKKRYGYMIAPDKPAPVSGTGINPGAPQFSKTGDGTEYVVAQSEQEIIDSARKKGLVAGSEQYLKFKNLSMQKSNLKG